MSRSKRLSQAPSFPYFRGPFSLSTASNRTSLFRNAILFAALRAILRLLRRRPIFRFRPSLRSLSCAWWLTSRGGSSMDDRRNCQTSNATPAEPGDLSWRLAERAKAPKPLFARLYVLAQAYEEKARAAQSHLVGRGAPEIIGWRPRPGLRNDSRIERCRVLRQRNSVHRANRKWVESR